MIEELRLQALGIIDETVLELGPGLTVVTGETGAGKTMVVTALGLLLGGRGDAGLVRSGAKQARIEGRVRVRGGARSAGSGQPHGAAGSVADGNDADGNDADEAIRRRVEELGGDLDEDANTDADTAGVTEAHSSLLLIRTISAEGRSRAVLGGASVPIGRLGEISDLLVAVHGQSDQHRLLRAGHQREALDRFGGAELARVASGYAEAYRRLRATERELDDVTATARERAREAEMLRIGLEELEAAALEPAEDAQLVAEEGRLAHADALRTAAGAAQRHLSGDADSVEDTLSQDALAQLDGAKKALERVREHDPQAAALADRLAELTYLAADLATEVAGYAASVDVDPARLGAVQERRALITALSRKYGETVDDMLVWGEQAAKRLVDLEGTDDRIAQLRTEAGELRDGLGALALRLSELRQEAACRLATQVTEELTALAMPHARLSVRVRRRPATSATTTTNTSTPTTTTSTAGGGCLRVAGQSVACTVHGIDEVDLLLAANADSEPRPLDKGASGGELSRVMLALEVVLADRNPVPTLVFDEVDAGVGGRAAIEIGRRLARLARHSQVLVVTHLPQVAAFADRHYVVVKSGDGTVTRSGLHDLDDDARVQELSRMLAGVEDSSAAQIHAQELLEMAAPERRRP
ncbi:MAG TPA: DNA repair protein RecN [Nocardioidaceae bacterium]|nr:DNA repair protein RecN [Nocardioidaceae bacterium]